MIIEQQSNGIPGSEGDKISRQRILLEKGRLKFIDSATGRYSIASLGKKVFWIVDPTLHEYVEKPFSYFEKLRQEKEEDRRRGLEELKKIKDLREREELARRSGIRLDGKVLAEIEKTGEASSILGYEAKHWILKENGIILFNLWWTDQIPRPDDLFAFYEQLGAFGDEIVKKSREIQGFPLKLKVFIDLGAVRSEIESEVLKITECPIPASEFDLPDGLRKVEEFGKKAAEKRKTACPICGKAVNPSRTAPNLIFRWKGRTHFFCSAECKKKYIRKLKESK
jgi:YHS domain-containing protein